MSQFKFAKDLVTKFGLQDSKPPNTPICTSNKITTDPTIVEVGIKLYRSMISRPLYLTTSKLDITFSVGVCARYQVAPKESHLITVKKIIKYVNYIINPGLWYPFDINSIIIGYLDSNWT